MNFNDDKIYPSHGVGEEHIWKHRSSIEVKIEVLKIWVILTLHMLQYFGYNFFI